MPVTPLRVAVMLVEPVSSALARPLCRPTVATVGSEELQVAWPVMFSLFPLSKVPVAVKDRLVPGARVKGLGVMAIETRLAALTVKLVLLLFPSLAAPMVVEPTPTPIASPLLAMLATKGADEDQVTVLVMSCVVLSE